MSNAHSNDISSSYRARAASTSSSVSAGGYSQYSDATSDASGSVGGSHAPSDDFVLAMHNFIPEAGNVQCLGFRAGQVIHVINRDATGWWDGELDGRRGWFPSNYVNTQPIVRQTQTKRIKKSRARDRQVGSLRGHSPTLSSSSHQDTPALLVSLVQALSLLQSAVHARRVTHFQPSTACIISCVRSVLSATDCLGRDSPALLEHQTLALARKQVLADLAQLVKQTRKASDTRPHLREEEVDFEINEMLRMGHMVFEHVRNFLDIAIDCNLDLPDRRANSPSFDIAYQRAMDEGSSVELPVGSVQERAEGTTSSSMQHHPSLRTQRARSLVDLRGQTRSRTTSAGTDDDPSLPGYHAPSRQSSVRQSRHIPPPTNTISPTRSQASRVSAASSTTSFISGTTSTVSSSADGADGIVTWPLGPTSTAEVLVTLRATHDRLLSIIAAFIGHVHSHSQNAHASSKGHLIEMTRETVDQVRQLLAIVDSVMATPDIAETKPRELITLEVAKTTLYSYTSSLVDSIRTITSLGPSPENGVIEDEQKGLCLQAATGALRAGAECVTSVKLCLSRRIGEEPFIIFIHPPPSPDTPQQQAQAQQMDELGGRHSDEDAFREENEAYDSALSDIEEAEAATADRTFRQSVAATPRRISYVTADEFTPRAPQAPDNNIQVSPTPRGTTSSLHNPKSSVSIFVQDDGSTPVPRKASHTLARNREDRANQTVLVSENESGVDGHTSDSSPGTSETSESGGGSMVDIAGQSGSSLNSTNGKPTLEEKIRSGALPSVPPLSAFVKPPMAPAPPTITAPPIRQSLDTDGPYAWLLEPDYDPRDISLNAEGAIIGASLNVLIEKMTPHRSFPEPSFAIAFYLTFRLFTTPKSLLEGIITRFSIQPPNEPPLTPSELRIWHDRKLLPVRVRICNLLKTWLESYWQPVSDNAVLPRMQEFVRDRLLGTPLIGQHAQRVLDMIVSKRGEAAPTLRHSRSADRLRPGFREGVSAHMGTGLAPGPVTTGVPPTPVMNKTLHSSLRSSAFNAVSVLDFDVLELARQLTLMESKLYCAIRPEELMASGQAGVRASESVRAVTSLSTSITGWVTECILNETDARKRTGLLKYFIKLANRCLTQLSNFSTLRAIMAALDSSTISRLTKTWAGLPARHRATLDGLRKVVDHSRNHAEYRVRLRATAPPGIPFLGIYLTDIIFCRDGNPPTRASPSDPSRTLLNFHRYAQLSRIVLDMQRFQIPYNLFEIAEAQRYLSASLGDVSKSSSDLQDLYRRSLVLEPRQPSDQAQSQDKGRDLFGWSRLGGSS